MSPKGKRNRQSMKDMLYCLRHENEFLSNENRHLRNELYLLHDSMQWKLRYEGAVNLLGEIRSTQIEPIIFPTGGNV